MATVQKLYCRVECIVAHGEQVYTVELKPERPAPRFRPGQFLHLALDDYDPSGFWPESRVFSIASSPTQREQLSLSYSVRGRFTARMERELAEGRSIWVKLPYGDFVVQDARDVVLFAGGTGITAFTAFIVGLTSDFGHHAYLFYGARRKELLIYKGLCDATMQRMQAFHAFYFVEQTTDDLSAAMAGDIAQGRLSVAAAWPQLRDPLAADYYLSGPPPMLKAFAEDLRQRQVKPEAIRMDAWE